MTDAEFKAWLANPSAIRGVLVEATVRDVLAAQEVKVYLSNIGYLTQDSLTSFLPIISGGVQWSENLPVDGSATLSFGDIQLINLNGEYDHWLDHTKYIWANRSIQIYIGDPFFKCANLAEVYTKFQKVFDGIISDIDSQSRDRLNIKIQDKLGLLNTSLNDTKIGVQGTWGLQPQPNVDDLQPLVFGEVFNITPTQTDPSLMEYQVNTGITEDIIEIRDNGVPIYTSSGGPSAATIFLSTGKFRLIKPAQGYLTCSVQGVKNSMNLTNGTLVAGTYTDNITNLIVLIATQYGTNKLTAADLDLANLSLFASTNTQSVGVYINDTSNVLATCQDLAGSIGAQVFMTREGKLQMLRIGAPTADPSVTITDADILHHSLSIVARIPVQASQTLSFCRNWSVQANLQTAIYPADRENFSIDVYKKTSDVDTTTKDRYKLPINPPAHKDTLLIVKSETDAETLRLRDYYKTPRTVYSFTGTSALMSLKLGQAVVLQHSRFGLSSGVSGQVVGLSPNWLNSSIKVEVII